MRGLTRVLDAMRGATSGPGSNDPKAALQAAVVRGTASDLRAWAATGTAGLHVLKRELAGPSQLDTSGVHAREVIDGLSAAVAEIASANPAAFLEVFADPALDTDSFVLTGLGYVDDPRATERLVNAAQSDDQWIRMAATIGLGRQHAEAAVPALTELLADSEYLVRYHALQGLAAVGDARAIPALRAFEGPSQVEREMADAALEAIASR